MLKLTQFYPVWNLPNASTFCMKLETYLRMCDIPYENDYSNNPKISPKGKFPMITTEDGKVISDSGLIIDYLKRKHGDKLDANLTAEQKAQALSLRRLIEEHLYWVLMYSRWVDPNGWAVLNSLFFGKMSMIPKIVVSRLVRKHMLAQLKGHGMGLHDRDTVYQLGKDDIKAIADTLNDKAFMFGDNPTSIDACVFGIIANIIGSPIENPLKEFTLQFDNLKKHTDKMKAKYFPDL